MNKICIINDNLLFVVVFMHEICRINMQIMHIVVFEGENKRYFRDFLHFSCLKLAVLNFFCLFLQQLIFKPVINKLINYELIDSAGHTLYSLWSEFQCNGFRGAR